MTYRLNESPISVFRRFYLILCPAYVALAQVLFSYILSCHRSCLTILPDPDPTTSLHSPHSYQRVLSKKESDQSIPQLSTTGSLTLIHYWLKFKLFNLALKILPLLFAIFFPIFNLYCSSKFSILPRMRLSGKIQGSQIK